MNKKFLFTIAGVSTFALTSVGVSTFSTTDTVQAATNQISKNQGMKLLKKAGYKNSELKNAELLNSNSNMTTINTYKQDGNQWIKNTYTLFNKGDNTIEIHLQSYSGQNKNDPASFQAQVKAAGHKTVILKNGKVILYKNTMKSASKQGNAASENDNENSNNGKTYQQQAEAYSAASSKSLSEQGSAVKRNSNKNDDDTYGPDHHSESKNSDPKYQNPDLFF